MPLSLVVEAVDAARVGGGPAVDRLIDVLVMVDEAGDQSVARDALARVQAAPRVIVRLDERGRRFVWSRGGRSPVLDRAAPRLDDDLAGPIAVALASTHHDGHVRERAVGRIVDRPDPAWLLATAGAAERRFLIEIGLAHGWWSADVMFALATTDTNVRVRAGAADLVCRQVVWSERVETLRRLARHPGPEVRQVALIGLLRLGHATEVAAYLDDRAPLIRAIAREAARRADIHAVQHYRHAVTEPEPATGAIAGLAETGAAADGKLLARLLVHPHSRVRAQAVRALRHLDAVPVEQTIPLLQDPSPAVIREATAALTPLTRALPAELAPRLLIDPHRSEVRRAGYRLLRARGPFEQLRAALLLAADPDPRLARRAVADATRLARDATDPGRRRRVPTIDVSAVLAELIELTNLSATALGPDITSRLNAWLTSNTPRA